MIISNYLLIVTFTVHLKPVLVYLHGGAFMFGSGIPTNYCI